MRSNDPSRRGPGGAEDPDGTGGGIRSDRVRSVAGLVVGPVAAVALLLSNPPAGLSETGWRVAAVGVWMAVWWLTEAIPIPATALMPLALFPALGVREIKAVAAPYANPVIFLFLGGFLLALAVERWGLHRRVALAILARLGMRPSRMIAGFMLATALLSSAVSNTATTVMMIPLGLSVVAVVRTEIGDGHDDALVRFARSMVLGIAYAASIGGVATLIGTPPNALLAGFMEETHGLEIGFAQWLVVGVPLVAILLPVAWWVLVRGRALADLPELDEHGAMLPRERAALGRPSRGEAITAATFVIVALAWVTRPWLVRVLPGLTDAGIAIAGGLALFAIPVDRGLRTFVLDWKTARGVPWDILILFGGGLSLAAAVQETGLAIWIGGGVSRLGGLPLLALMVAVVALLVFLTELTSNTASVAAFLPVVTSVAIALGRDPLYLAVPAAVAASCAFMLPVATPPNAIAYGSGRVTIPQMARAGFSLNLICIVAIPVVTYWTISWAFAVAAP